MSDDDLITVTVHLVHGEPVKFEVRLTAAKEMNLSEDIEQSLVRNAMAVELNKKLLIIPYSNIKYVECDPAPSTLPLKIIRGAKLLKS